MAAPARQRKPFVSAWTARRDIPWTILGWLAVVFIAFWLLAHISRTLIILLIGSLFAYSLLPVIHFLERFIPRIAAILLTYLFLFIAISFFIYAVTTAAIGELVSLSHNIQAQIAPGTHLTVPFMTQLSRLGIGSGQIETLLRQITLQAENISRSILPFITGAIAFVFDGLLVAIVSIYLILDGDRLIGFMHKMLPASQGGNFRFALSTLEKVVGGYIRGQTLLAGLVGVFVTLGMLALKVPYAVLLGVIAFVFEFIPIVGVFLSGAICLLLALTQGWLTALFVLGYFVVIHVLEGEVVGPRIVGRALGLHPLISILALIAGSELYGILGALLAAPIAGVAQAVLLALLNGRNRASS